MVQAKQQQGWGKDVYRGSSSDLGRRICSTGLPGQHNSTRSCSIGSTTACHRNLMSVIHKSSFISLEGSKCNSEFPSPSMWLYSTSQRPKLLFFKAGTCVLHCPNTAMSEIYPYLKLKNLCLRFQLAEPSSSLMVWAAFVPRARLHRMGCEKPLAVPLLPSVPRLRGAQQAAELLANQEQQFYSIHLTLLLQGQGLLKPDLQRLLPSTLLLCTCSAYVYVYQTCTSLCTYIKFIHAHSCGTQCRGQSPVTEASFGKHVLNYT